ncbi:MAG: hypothetical protein ACSLFI_08295 [Solirubrobacterales bacterium]
MSDPQPEQNSDRIPRGAIAVVIVGLVLTVIVFAIDLRGGSSSGELEWQVFEEVQTPVKSAEAGKNGEIGMRRTSISALPPNGGGQLVFRIGGVAVVEAGTKPTEVRCAVTATGQDTTIARTPNLRAVWPRPSDDLQDQEFPESLVLKFNAVGKEILGVPISDVIRRYIDTLSPASVDWDTDVIGTQEWVWSLPKGTGPAPAALGYVVVFRTAFRPEADLRCSVDIAGQKASQKARAVLQEWPIADEDAETVETDPELDVE